jgi:hypothetical protein
MVCSWRKRQGKDVIAREKQNSTIQGRAKIFLRNAKNKLQIKKANL